MSRCSRSRRTPGLNCIPNFMVSSSFLHFWDFGSSNVTIWTRVLRRNICVTIHYLKSHLPIIIYDYECLNYYFEMMNWGFSRTWIFEVKCWLWTGFKSFFEMVFTISFQMAWVMYSSNDFWIQPSFSELCFWVDLIHFSKCMIWLLLFLESYFSYMLD